MDGGSGSPVVSAATTTITTRVPDWLATQQAIDVPAPTSASGPGMDLVSHHGSSSSSTQVSPDTMYLYSDLGIMHSGPSSFLPSHFHPNGPALPPPPVATLNSRPQLSSSLGQTQGARPASSTLESASLSKETGSAVATERTAPRKRPIAIACDSCNKKHRGCDDIDPSHPVACTNCFTNGYECNYSKAAKSFAEELPA
ncbi:unnamed protein product [Tilletia laevis]|nr:unnamed protein product [Tilletia laevis]